MSSKKRRLAGGGGEGGGGAGGGKGVVEIPGIGPAEVEDKTVGACKQTGGGVCVYVFMYVGCFYLSIHSPSSCFDHILNHHHHQQQPPVAAVGPNCLSAESVRANIRDQHTTLAPRGPPPMGGRGGGGFFGGGWLGVVKNEK